MWTSIKRIRCNGALRCLIQDLDLERVIIIEDKEQYKLSTYFGLNLYDIHNRRINMLKVVPRIMIVYRIPNYYVQCGFTLARVRINE